MQPQDNITIPRRALDVEDYIDIMRRHKSWIFGPFLFTLVASVVGVYLWPDTFISQAVVKVVPQQVPENFVQSNVNQEMTDRINSMAGSILSRGTLTTIINNFNLYTRERSRQPIEDVVEDMRKQIHISPVSTLGMAGGKTISAFQVEFAYDNRYQAQKVVSDLVTRFIDQNTRERSSSSIQTTQFLREQWEEAKKELDGLETKLAQFRTANQGRLPEQMDSNMRQISAMQTQIATLNSSISRSSGDKLMMESTLRIYKDQLASLKAPADPVAAAQRNERVTELDRDIQVLEDRLAVLREHYQDAHPDVQQAKALLAVARRKRDEAVKAAATAAANPKPDTSARPQNPTIVRDRQELGARIRLLTSQIEAKDLEIQEYNKEINKLTNQIKAFQIRIEGIPLGEKTYTELMRDRDLAKTRYQDLDVKMQKSMMAQEMEGRKQGEALELLDPASLPETPTQPKRPIIIAIGAGLGLLIGFTIAGAREMKDTSLKNLKDVRAYTRLAVLGSVPLLENDFVVRRRRRLGWLGWTTACLAGAVIISGSIVYYYVTKV